MIDLTQSAEFMAALREALVAAAAGVDLGAGRGQGADAENEWLTPREAMAFLRMPASSFKRFRAAHPAKFVVSYALGPALPRYQLAALQRLMREKAVGDLESPAPAAADPAASSKPPVNGKHRGVSLRMAS